MTTKALSAFDPRSLPESNASIIPAPFDGNGKRWNRRLGNHAGLTNFGVNLTRVEPGGQTSYRHAHSKQDEFVWVVEGEVVLVTDAGEETVAAGHCAGFAHGTGNGHRFLNRSDRDAYLLVIGDRTPGDEVTYPDDDLVGRHVDGTFRFTRKDGSAL